MGVQEEKGVDGARAKGSSASLAHEARRRGSTEMMRMRGYKAALLFLGGYRRESFFARLSRRGEKEKPPSTPRPPREAREKRGASRESRKISC